MNDYTEMRKRLVEMTDRNFDSFMSDFYGVELTKETGEYEREYEHSTGAFRLLAPSENCRQDWTQRILAYKRTKPEQWDRVCSELGILEDSIRTMSIAQRANRIAILAIIVAVAAAHFDPLGKLLEWLKSP